MVANIQQHKDAAQIFKKDGAATLSKSANCQNVDWQMNIVMMKRINSDN